MLLSLLAVSAASAQGILVDLKPQASLGAGAILLGDVADLRGPDQDRLEALSRVSLGPVPVAGLIRRFTPEQVRDAVRTSMPESEITMAGATSVEVRLRCRAVSASEIIPAVKSHILLSTGWQGNEVEVLSVGRLKGIEIPAGDVEFRIASKAPLAHSRNLTLPVEVLKDGKSIQTLWITSEVSIKASVLQAIDRIPYGKKLAAEDVKAVPTDIADPSGTYVRSFEEVEGQILRRTLSPGEPLTREALTSPVLVKSGDMVRLRLARSGLNLAAMVRAEQSGKLGQVIRVRNLDFMRSIRAQVVGPGEVRVQAER